MSALKNYVIEYRSDPSCPIFKWRCKAYDVEHARDRFIESDFDTFGDWTDWEIISIKVAR
jgi:hypothetical protein